MTQDEYDRASAFAAHYELPWHAEGLSAEREAWAACWAAARKPCLHQIAEPAQQPEALQLIAQDLRAQHSLATPGKWTKGSTTHHTVSEREGQEPYRVAEFRHANDAAFCDLAHRYVPRILDELDAQHVRIAELEAEKARLIETYVPKDGAGIAYAAPAHQAAQSAVLVPRELLVRAVNSLGSFVGDEGWGQSDMDTMDDVVAMLAAPAHPAEGVRAAAAVAVPDVSAALDRMDALLNPAFGLLTVGPDSATVQASRSDLRTIRAALAATPAAPAVDPIQAAADAASVGHLAHLLDHQSALLARSMAAMKAMEQTASPIDESNGDLDARIPYEAWAAFVDARATLLHDVAQSPVAAPAAAPVVLPEPDAAVSEVMELVDLHAKARSEYEAHLDDVPLYDEGMDLARTQLDKQRNAVETKLRALLAQASAADARDAAFEAVRKGFCTLPRYSFYLDDDGCVRRVPDRTGNWVEFDAAHALFDPVAVDAAIAARAAQGGAA